MASADAPELNSPITARAESSVVTSRAFVDTRFGVQLPACLVALLSVTNLIAFPPAIPPASCSAWRAPSLIARVCTDAAPLSGSEE